MSVQPKLTLYVNGAPVASRNLASAPVHNPLKDTLDRFNSICWLTMDAFWVFELPKVGLFFGLPAIITGMLMLRIDSQTKGLQPYVFWNSLSTNCWIWMNVMWMLSDSFADYEHQFLFATKGFLTLGLACVVTGAMKSGGVLKTFSNYKGYKHFQLLRNRK